MPKWAEIAIKPACTPPMRWRNRLWRALLVILMAGFAAELICRIVLGLGDPPLFVDDPKMGYLAKPSCEYSRFGNRVAYNQWSMRSPDFAHHKSAEDEYRVLVIGDSVVNGGSLTDQSNLATEILQNALQRALHRPVIVGNISAGGWGPLSQLEYVRRFGFFEADAVVIVVSSHDHEAQMSFDPIEKNPNTPTSTPPLALVEAFTRYAPRYLPAWFSSAAPAEVVSESDRMANIEGSSRAFHDLLQLAEQSGAHVIVMQHLTTGELASGPEPGHDVLKRIAQKTGARVAQLGPAFAQAISKGQQPFRDDIHLSNCGQQLLADALLSELLSCN